MTLLEELVLEDFCLDDGIEMSPKEVFAYLNRVVYNRRTKWVLFHVLRSLLSRPDQRLCLHLPNFVTAACNCINASSDIACTASARKSPWSYIRVCQS